MGRLLKRVLKSKGGFTLVELVVAMVVFTIFAVGAISIVMPVVKQYTQTVEQMDATALANSIVGELSAELAYADKIDTKGNTITYSRYNNPEKKLAINNEGILVSGSPSETVADMIPVFDPLFYKKCGVDITYTPDTDGNYIDVDIKVTSSYTKAVTIDRSITLKPLKAPIPMTVLP